MRIRETPCDMKCNLILILGAMLVLASLCLAQGDTWTTKTEMPDRRSDLSASAVGEKIYVMGGTFSVQGSGSSRVAEYDPAADIWTRKTDMPTARSGLSSSVFNGKVYAIGGATGPSGSALSAVEEYDPSTDSWTRKSSMPTARQGLSTPMVNGKIYAIGGVVSVGISGGEPLSVVEEYNPAADTWTTKAEMPTARYALCTGVVNGKIYAIGGSSTQYRALATVEEYDPATDTWTTKAEMPTARYDLSASVVNGRIYTIGGIAGRLGAPGLSTVEVYDPATNTWTTKEEMPTARSALAAAAVDGNIYAIGGAIQPLPNFVVTSVVEEYDTGFEPEVITGFSANDKLATTWGQIKS